MSEFDTEFTRNAVCPYCGHLNMNSSEINHGEEGESETDCGDCGKDYLVDRHVFLKYSTSKIKGEGEA